MATLTTEIVNSLQEFVRLIELLVLDPKDPYWFRGVGEENYRLLPSLYRHPTITDRDELLKLEKSLIDRFVERSVPYQSTPLATTWESIFLMQHYGIPTRLLDWTENPMVALFFALTAAIRNPDSKVAFPAAVWALSPKFWNERAFSHVSYKGSALSVSDTLLKSYAPLSGDIPPSLPAAIYGIHNSPRIIAQRGVFTIFGSSLVAIQDIFQEEAFPESAMIKYVIPADMVDPILQKLYCTGFTEAVLFPGLDGLAKETKRLFGFKE